MVAEPWCTLGVKVHLGSAVCTSFVISVLRPKFSVAPVAMAGEQGAFAAYLKLPLTTQHQSRRVVEIQISTSDSILSVKRQIASRVGLDTDGASDIILSLHGRPLPDGSTVGACGWGIGAGVVEATLALRGGMQQPGSAPPGARDSAPPAPMAGVELAAATLAKRIEKH